MGKILEASQLTIGFRRHGNSKSRPKRRIRRIPNKLTRKNQLEKPTASKVYGKRGGIEVSEMLLRQTDRGTINAVDQVSLTIEKGEILGIIGESGSGKSTLAFGLLNLIDVPGEVLAGQVYYWQSGEAIDLFFLRITGRKSLPLAGDRNGFSGSAKCHESDLNSRRTFL